MWTKRQLITSAFEEAGLAAFAYDLTPDQTQSAIARLDSMMTAWDAEGVRIGYNVGTDPDQLSGIPDTANEAVFTGLAIRLAPSYGKQISADTRATYKQGLDTLKLMSAMPAPMSLPAGYPMGAGNRSLTQPFITASADSLTVGGDPLELEP